jgi:hypothetical protein
LCFQTPEEAALDQCDVVFFCHPAWCGHGASPGIAAT